MISCNLVYNVYNLLRSPSNSAVHLKFNTEQSAPPRQKVTMLLILLNVEMFFALMATITHAIEVRLDVNEALLRVHWNFYGASLISKRNINV